MGQNGVMMASKMSSSPPHDEEDESTISHDSQRAVDAGGAVDALGADVVPNDPPQTHEPNQSSSQQPPNPANALGVGYLGKLTLSPQYFAGRASPIDVDTQFDVFTIKPAKHIRFLSFTVGSERLFVDGKF